MITMTTLIAFLSGILLIPFIIIVYSFMKAEGNWKIFRENLRTSMHKVMVFRFILKAAWALIKRGVVHDLSKYELIESRKFTAAKKLKTMEYGDPEYLETIKVELREALNHHYENNSHHPEHYINGVRDMSYFDIIEMLCDWKAAGLRTKGGSMRKSIEYNTERFDLDSVLRNKLIETAEEIGLMD